jgi:hypothetical protein
LNIFTCVCWFKFSTSLRKQDHLFSYWVFKSSTYILYTNIYHTMLYKYFSPVAFLVRNTWRSKFLNLMKLKLKFSPIESTSDFILIFWFIYSFTVMCIHCMGHFFPLPSFTLSSPHFPCFQAEPVLPSSILLKRRHKQ